MRCWPLRAALALLSLAAASATARAACNLQKIAELPVDVAGLRAIVPAKIDGQAAKLQVDTGAFFSTLAPASATRLGLKPGPLPPGMVIRGLNGEADMHYATAKDFTLAGLPLRGAGFLVAE